MTFGNHMLCCLSKLSTLLHPSLWHPKINSKAGLGFGYSEQSFSAKVCSRQKRHNHRCSLTWQARRRKGEQEEPQNLRVREKLGQRSLANLVQSSHFTAPSSLFPGRSSLKKKSKLPLGGNKISLNLLPFYRPLYTRLKAISTI